MPVINLNNMEAFIWRNPLQLMGIRRRLVRAIDRSKKRESGVKISRSLALALLEACDQAIQSERGFRA